MNNLTESEIEIFAKAIELSKDKGISLMIHQNSFDNTQVQLIQKSGDSQSMGNSFQLMNEDKHFLHNTKSYIKTVLS